MAETRKSYGEGCLAAHALDLVGDRWAMLIVRELMLGPKRFGAIKRHLPGVATNMLTRRLEDLEAGGVVTHRVLPAPASAPVYDLTAHGTAFWPVLRELCRWGVAMSGFDPGLPISPTALMLSMQSMMLPGKGDHSAAFDMEGEHFLFTIRGNIPATHRQDRPSAPIRFAGSPNMLAPVIYGPGSLASIVEAGMIEFEGDLAAGQAFVDRFALDRPAFNSAQAETRAG